MLEGSTKAHLFTIRNGCPNFLQKVVAFQNHITTNADFSNSTVACFTIQKQFTKDVNTLFKVFECYMLQTLDQFAPCYVGKVGVDNEIAYQI